jgi:ABC-2 type transport system permease protein
MTAAFVYLATCSIRNGLGVRLRRLRQPRYLLITLGMLLYVANMVFNRPAAGFIAFDPGLYQNAQAIGTAVALLLLVFVWILSGGAALRFTLPEVHLLFPAPIDRRQLIAYKLARLLTAAFSTALVLALLAGPRHVAPAVSFISRSFMVFAMLGFFEAAVSLYKQSAKDGKQVQGAARTYTLLSAGVVTLVLGWVLARVVLAPLDDVGQVLPLAVLTLAIMATWVLGSDAAFEEAAAEAASDRTKPIAAALPRVTRSNSYKLAPRGPVETAILWKNWMLIGRRSRVQVFITAIVLAAIVFVAALFAVMVFESDVVPIVSFAVAGFVVFLGPIMLRIDLRRDLAHLAVFKTWPVGGAAIIRGEVLAPFLALFILLPIPLAAAAGFDRSLLFGSEPALLSRCAFAASALLIGSAMILAQLVIQNGIAVTFPAWVRINPAAGAAGMEMMGQMMITQYGGVFLLMLALVPPSAVAAGLWFVLGGLFTWAAVMVPAVVFAVLTTIECLVATELLGRVLDRTDLQALSIAD